MNERVVALHLIEDVLGWVAVLIGSVVLLFREVPWLDPLISILLSAYILFNVFKNLRSILRIFLQGTPPGLDEAEIRKQITDIEGIYALYDLHVWSLDGKYIVMTASLGVDPEQNLHQLEALKTKVRAAMRALKIDHVTLEVEPRDPTEGP